MFDDVADIVGGSPVPHVCRFRISPLLAAEPGDMVAIYRVPNVAPHEYTNYVDVDHAEAEDNEKGRRVVFEPVNLPEEEDFYQFQYVRGGNQGCRIDDFTIAEINPKRPLLAERFQLCSLVLVLLLMAIIKNQRNCRIGAWRVHTLPKEVGHCLCGKGRREEQIKHGRGRKEHNRGGFFHARQVDGS